MQITEILLYRKDRSVACRREAVTVCISQRGLNADFVCSLRCGPWAPAEGQALETN